MSSSPRHVIGWGISGQQLHPQFNFLPGQIPTIYPIIADEVTRKNIHVDDQIAFLPLPLSRKKGSGTVTLLLICHKITDVIAHVHFILFPFHHQNAGPEIVAKLSYFLS